MSARTIDDDLERRTLAELWLSCDRNAIQFMNLINEFIGRRAGHVEHSPAASKWFEREQAEEKAIDAWRDHSCASSLGVREARDDDNKSNLNCSIDSSSQAGEGNGLNDSGDSAGNGRDRGEDSGDCAAGCDWPNGGRIDGRRTGGERCFSPAKLRPSAFSRHQPVHRAPTDELAADEDKLNSCNLNCCKINKSHEAQRPTGAVLDGSGKQKCIETNGCPTSFTADAPSTKSPIKRFEFCNIKNEQEENHKTRCTADWTESVCFESVCSSPDCSKQKFIGSKLAAGPEREFSTGDERNEPKNHKQLSDSGTPTHSPQSGNVFTRSDNFAAAFPAIDRNVDPKSTAARRLNVAGGERTAGRSLTERKPSDRRPSEWNPQEKRSQDKRPPDVRPPIEENRGADQKTVKTENCHNGSDVYDFKSKELVYSWSQSLSDLDITVPIPKRLTSKSQCRVIIRSDGLTVEFEEMRDHRQENALQGNPNGAAQKANKSDWIIRLDGQLAHPIRTSSACWTLDLSSRCLRLFLEKQQQRWWNCCLVNGEPELDLGALERTIAYDQLTSEEQNVIQQLTYRARLSADG